MSVMNQLQMPDACPASLCPGRLTVQNIKNEGRSEEVIENKGSHDIMPDKKSDLMSENAGIPPNCVRLLFDNSGIFKSFTRSFMTIVSHLDRPLTILRLRDNVSL